MHAQTRLRGRNSGAPAAARRRAAARRAGCASNAVQRFVGVLVRIHTLWSIQEAYKAHISSSPVRPTGSQHARLGGGGGVHIELGQSRNTEGDNAEQRGEDADGCLRHMALQRFVRCATQFTIALPTLA
eukprot:COSAG02_NODE_4327_length_5497_cov_934.755465_1_plen_129_part_00